MSDSYAAVVGGGLKLKGGIKKKKKKGSSNDGETTVAAAAVASSSSSSVPSLALSSGHTAAELRRMETMMKRTVEKLEKGEIKSHRDRVKDFNAYLGNLTEHYDLPKVSKGMLRRAITLSTIVGCTPHPALDLPPKTSRTVHAGAQHRCCALCRELMALSHGTHSISWPSPSGYPRRARRHSSRRPPRTPDIVMIPLRASTGLRSAGTWYRVLAGTS